MTFFTHRKSRMKRLISAYHDGEIDRRESDVLQAHLEVCARCRNELADQRELSEQLATALKKEETPDILPDVLSALGRRRAQESRGMARLFQRTLRPALVYAAAAAFGITAGILISSSLGVTTTAEADPLPIQYLTESPPNSLITLYYGDTGEVADE